MDLGTRLSSRVVCFSSRFKSKPLEEKIIHTACFVIVLLLFPFFAKSYSSLFIMTSLHSLALNLYSPLIKIERTLFSLPNMFTLLCQLTFFSQCDRVLLTEHKISSLYTLIFYNVLTYCVSYIMELITKESWCMYVTVSDTCSLKHLSMTVTKLVLEWTKAITFLITFVFLLLAFTLEQALDKYFPTKLYLGVTFLHYIATEKFFVSQFPRLLASLDLASVDGLEEYYAPIILKLFTLCLSTLSCLASLLCKLYTCIPLCAYLNIFLVYKQIDIVHLPALRNELNLLKPYRYATQQELTDWNDICPICLNTLTLPRTRITPCFHLFHADCLRKYLKLLRNNTCPMCKKMLLM
ncbi:hypothetical protein M8J76_016859 [Diaphorina citri]|nr:hypothetical protein M8J76_016859 [Diaphorina citri]